VKNKRIRQKPVTQRVNQKSYPKLELGQALSIVLAGKSAEGVRERTIMDYERDWGYFVKWLDENYEVTTIDQITTDIMRNYINYCKYDAPKYNGHKFIDSDKQGIGLSDTTINIRIRVYKALFNYLEREELIEFNPLNNVKLLRQDVDLRNGLTEQEVKDILRQPNQRDYVGFRDFVAINLLLDSGLRIQELLSLRSQDVDFKTRFVTVSSNVSKNRHSRLVPISAHTCKLLLQLINENQVHFKTDRVFLSSYGENLGANNFNKRLKYYAEKAGYNVKDKCYTAHAYRHTWAVEMVRNGADPFTIQKMGAWSDIRTMRRYVQIDTEDMRRSHDEYSPVMKYVNKRTGTRAR
jgi:integrase/recombinase XerD